MKLTLVKKIKYAPDIVTFLFKPNKPFKWKAGQYLQYSLKHHVIDNRGDRRYFTISTAPYENMVGLTSQFFEEKSSSFKKALFGMEIGYIIEARGPYGDFVVKNQLEKYIFIAGGIGITPFRAIILDLARRKIPINVMLLYANSARDFLFKSDFEKIAKDDPNFSISYFISPDRINEETIRNIAEYEKNNFYISGPAPMVFGIEDILEKMNIAQIKTDDFPGYTEY